MLGKSTLREKVREDAVSHTAWHFTGEKLLAFLERRWREWLWAAVVAAATTVGGYVRGLSRLKLTVAAIGAAAVVILVFDVIIAAKGRKVRTFRPPSAESAEKLGEVRFDHPGSPLDEWVFSSDDPTNNSMPEFSAAVERPGGLKMVAPWTHHIDLKPEPHHKVCDRVRFAMKLSRDSHESYAYAKILLRSKDGKEKPKTGWIACDVGNKPSAKHSVDEWIVYGRPLADGWTPFELNLRDEVEKSHFAREQGFDFGELLSVRLRGSISVSPIIFYRDARRYGPPSTDSA
jgi:hypothetical protein